ncbi:MAG TPA: saccharopine dehydrogenase NADP-binding domain-containing protein [Arthrobacter sp.]|uniref:saccharopine dehydrogenase NADP-binding domain-containing protein n=1 Tax=Arthrobacter sp. TaxID=1667 RepID=UPI002F4094E4
MDNSSGEHDLVLYGATGFVGRLIAVYVAEHAPAGMRVGLAGRSRSRLGAVRSQLPVAAHGWALIEADSEDADSIAALAAGTRVLFTTVGPYAKHGLPVVDACARAGTHYADLAGEVSFVREAIDRYDALARTSRGQDRALLRLRLRAVRPRRTAASSGGRSRWRWRFGRGATRCYGQGWHQRRHTRIDARAARRDAIEHRPEVISRGPLRSEPRPHKGADDTTAS